MTRSTHLLTILGLHLSSFHGLVAAVTAIPCTPSVVIVVIAIAIALVISCPTGFFGFLRTRGTAKVRQLQRQLWFLRAILPALLPAFQPDSLLLREQLPHPHGLVILRARFLLCNLHFSTPGFAFIRVSLAVFTAHWLVYFRARAPFCVTQRKWITV